MGQRGKAPMPQALRLLRGDPNRDRYNENEPVPKPGEMIIPPDVSPEVAHVWRTRLIELEAMGLAFPSDVDCWRAFCEAVVMFEKASAVLAKSPILVKGLHGGLVRNPAAQLQRDSSLTLLRFADRFGLNPSARNGVESTLSTRRDTNPFAGTG